MAAEDLQAGWAASRQLLNAALDNPKLDLRRFSVRVRRLAAEIANSEPLLAMLSGSRLAFWTAMFIQAEVLLARHEVSRQGEVIEAFARDEGLVGGGRAIRKSTPRGGRSRSPPDPTAAHRRNDMPACGLARGRPTSPPSQSSRGRGTTTTRSSA